MFIYTATFPYIVYYETSGRVGREPETGADKKTSNVHLNSTWIFRMHRSFLQRIEAYLLEEGSIQPSSWISFPFFNDQMLHKFI